MAFASLSVSKGKKVFMGPKMPCRMKYEKLIRFVIWPIRMKSLLREQEPQEVKKNVFNERKKVFNECFRK